METLQVMDKRVKYTPEQLGQALMLRHKGWSYRAIGQELGMKLPAVMYHLNPDYRKKKIANNSALLLRIMKDPRKKRKIRAKQKLAAMRRKRLVNRMLAKIGGRRKGDKR